MTPLTASTKSPALGPFLLAPHHVPKVWGGRALAAHGRSLPDGPVGESFEASALPAAPSRVAAGAHEGRDLCELEAHFGRELLGPHATLPFLLKILDVREPLSVQVHPGPERSAAMGLSCDKSEGWVILQAGPRAKVGLGLLPSVSRPELERHCLQGTPQDLLHSYYPRAGEAYFLESGTVHYADGGILLYEFQRPADATLRLYDWGRTRPDGSKVSLSDALDATFEGRKNGLPGRPASMLFNAARKDGTFEAAGFRVRYMAIDGPGQERHLATAGNVLALTVIEGELSVEAADAAPVAASAIATVLVPACVARATVSGRGAALVCEVRA